MKELENAPLKLCRCEHSKEREENPREFTKNVNDRRLPQRDTAMRRIYEVLNDLAFNIVVGKHTYLAGDL